MHWGWVYPAAAASAGHSRTRTGPWECLEGEGCPLSPGGRKATVLWDGRPHRATLAAAPPSPAPPTAAPPSPAPAATASPRFARPTRLSPSAQSRLGFQTDLSGADLRFLNSPLQALIGSFKTQLAQPSPLPIGLHGTGGGSSGASRRSHGSPAVERDLKGGREAKAGPVPPGVGKRGWAGLGGAGRGASRLGAGPELRAFPGRFHSFLSLPAPALHA